MTNYENVDFRLLDLVYYFSFITYIVSPRIYIDIKIYCLIKVRVFGLIM